MNSEAIRLFLLQAVCGGKDLCHILGLELKNEWVMDGKNGKNEYDELARTNRGESERIDEDGVEK